MAGGDRAARWSPPAPTPASLPARRRISPRPDPCSSVRGRRESDVWLAGCGWHAEGPVKAVRDGEHVRSQVVDRGQPHAQQSGVDAAAQDVQDVLHPRLAVGGQPPQVGAADHHRAGAQGEALTTSEPRRMPPSSTTSIWSPTASAIGLTIRIEAGVPSRLLPPWLDTEIAVTPASTARRASSIRHTPFSMNGPRRPGPIAPASRRRRPTTGAVWSSTRSRHRRTWARPRRAERGWAPSGPGGRLRGRTGLATAAGPSPGAPAASSSSGRPSPGSPGCPSRGPSRTTSPAWRSARPHRLLWPASSVGSSHRARRSSTSGRTSAGSTATTSSTDLLAKLERPITVPRAAAARATATSPSGWTACTPVGEMITGREMS